jgi:hypothetical protein
MPDFILVTTLNGLQELYIVKPLLEEENINFYIKNENFIQMDPLYSVGTGGLDVMVVTADAQRAYDILKEAGYIIDFDTEPHLPLLDSIRNQFYRVGDIKLNKRMIVGLKIAGLLLITGLILYSFFGGTTRDDFSLNATDLRNSKWYVKSIAKNGKELKMHTTDKKGDGLINLLSTNELADFDGFETIKLPGLKSKAVKGIYSIISSDSVQVEKCDTLGWIYNGAYSVKFSNDGNRVEMVKDSVVIKLSKYL